MKLTISIHSTLIPSAGSSCNLHGATSALSSLESTDRLTTIYHPQVSPAIFLFFSLKCLRTKTQLTAMSNPFAALASDDEEEEIDADALGVTVAKPEYDDPESDDEGPPPTSRPDQR